MGVVAHDATVQEGHCTVGFGRREGKDDCCVYCGGGGLERTVWTVERLELCCDFETARACAVQRLAYLSGVYREGWMDGGREEGANQLSAVHWNRCLSVAISR